MEKNKLEAIKNEVAKEIEIVEKYEVKDLMDDKAVAGVLDNIKNVGTILKEKMISGIDYGTIPGTKKPSLYVPGAEKIAMIFGLIPRYEIIDKIVDMKSREIMYQFKCILTKMNSKGEAIVINEGYGAASSYEAAKKNSDFGGLVNNLLKIAKKRAFIDAIKAVAAASDVFAQDGELTQEYVSKQAKMSIYKATQNEFKIDKTKETQKTKVNEWISIIFKAWSTTEKKTMSSPMDEMTKQDFESWKNYVQEQTKLYTYSIKKGKVQRKTNETNI